MAQTNREKELLEQMRKDGFNVDCFIEKPNFFVRCPACGETISEEWKPALLYCGHIVCVKCIDEDDVRKCGPCNKQLLEKIKPYDLLLEYFKEQNKADQASPQEVKYHYSIKNMDSSKVQTVQNCPGSMTIEEILRKSIDFSSFLDTIGDKTGLIICGKNLIFSRIKDKTMVKLSQQKKFQLASASTKRTNQIAYYNYWKGGK